MAAATAEELAAAFSGALNDGDADALGALFTKDALFVNIAGMRMGGRDGIIDGHRWALAGLLRAAPSPWRISRSSPCGTTWSSCTPPACAPPAPTPRPGACRPAARSWSSPSSALRADGSRPRPPTPRSPPCRPPPQPGHKRQATATPHQLQLRYRRVHRAQTAAGRSSPQPHRKVIRHDSFSDPAATITARGDLLRKKDRHERAGTSPTPAGL